MEILGDYAYMTQETRDKLAKYDVTLPSGVYLGKMWEKRGFLAWYDREENDGVAIEYRQIKIKKPNHSSD